MRTGTLVLALTASGILGGLAVAVVSLPAAPAGPGAPTASALPPGGDGAAPETGSGDREFASLRARVEALEANLSAAAAENARLQTDLERQEEGLKAATTRIEELGTGGSIRWGSPGEGPVPGGFVRLDPTVSGSPVFPREIAERMENARRLRGLPEEDRWKEAREDLGLTSYQEEELKAALKERAEGIHAAFKTSESTGERTGNRLVVAMPDREKLNETRKNYDDRVSALLNADQAKKWKESGYESAMGGGPARTVISTTFTTEE